MVQIFGLEWIEDLIYFMIKLLNWRQAIKVNKWSFLPMAYLIQTLHEVFSTNLPSIDNRIPHHLLLIRLVLDTKLILIFYISLQFKHKVLISLHLILEWLVQFSSMQLQQCSQHLLQMRKSSWNPFTSL